MGGSRSGIPPGADAITYPAAGVKIAGGAPGIAPAIEGLNVANFFSASSTHFGNFNRGDWKIREVVTMVRGPHTLIFGGEVVRLRQDITNTNTQSGSFNFSSRLSGSNLVDFLLGRATDFTQGAGQYQQHGHQDTTTHQRTLRGIGRRGWAGGAWRPVRVKRGTRCGRGTDYSIAVGGRGRRRP